MRAGEKRSSRVRGKKAGVWISKCFLTSGLYSQRNARSILMVYVFFFSSSRKWDWLTTTLIMPETTAPTWASRIVVGPPCFQSSNLEMRGQCARTLLSKTLSNRGNFWRFWFTFYLCGMISNVVFAHIR